MEGNLYTTKLIDVMTNPEAKDDIGKLTQVFIVMEYIEYDFKKVMQNKVDNYSNQHVTILLYNMLCAFKFVHSAGILHRDIKPANILVNAECGIKLCDFGLSRIV